MYLNFNNILKSYSGVHSLYYKFVIMYTIQNKALIIFKPEKGIAGMNFLN